LIQIIAKLFEIPHVGLDEYTTVCFPIRARNSAPTRRAPVPLKHWMPVALPSFREGESEPNNMLVAALANGSYPKTGRYLLTIK